MTAAPAGAPVLTLARPGSEAPDPGAPLLPRQLNGHHPLSPRLTGEAGLTLRSQEKPVTSRMESSRSSLPAPSEHCTPSSSAGPPWQGGPSNAHRPHTAGTHGSRQGHRPPLPQEPRAPEPLGEATLQSPLSSLLPAGPWRPRRSTLEGSQAPGAEQAWTLRPGEGLWHPLCLWTCCPPLMRGSMAFIKLRTPGIWPQCPCLLAHRTEPESRVGSVTAVGACPQEAVSEKPEQAAPSPLCFYPRTGEPRRAADPRSHLRPWTAHLAKSTGV